MMKMMKMVSRWLVAGALALVTGCAVVDETGNPVRYFNLNGAVVDGATSDAADAADATPPADRLDVPPTGDVANEAGADAADGNADVLDAADSSDVSDAPVDITIVIDMPDTDVGMPIDMPVAPDVQPDRPDVPMGTDVVDAPTPIDVPVIIDMPPPPDVQPDRPDASMDTDVVDAPTPIDTPDVPDVSCPTGQTRCSGTCVDTRTSTAHCGACTSPCPGLINATATCSAGVCSLGACATGFANCDSVPANGCEVDTRTSVANCGACGTACPARTNASPTCVARVCGIICATGFANCDGNAANGCEVDTRTSATNCGACGNACASGICEAGTCLPHPVLDAVCADSRVVGLWVRTGDSGGGNPVGNWAYMTCTSTSPRISRIDLRRLSTPHSNPSMRMPITAWARTWGLEIIPMASMTTPLCPLGASTCPSCGTGAGFSCLRVQCALTGREADGNFTYAQAYNNDLPPGVSGSGTLYLARLGFLSSEFRDMCPP